MRLTETRRQSVIQHIPVAMLLVCIVLLPWVTFSQLLDHRLMSRGLLLASLMTVGYAFLSGLPSATPWSWHRNRLLTLLPFVVMFAGYLISGFIAPNAVEANYWMIKSGFWMLFVYWILRLKTWNGLTLKSISMAVAAATFVSWGVFAFEWVGNDAGIRSLHQLITPFGHKNLFASFLILSIPFVLNINTFNKGRFAKFIVWATVVAMIATVILLQAKTAFIGMAAGAIFLVVKRIQKWPPGLRWWTVALLSGVLGALVGLLFYFDGSYYTLMSGSWEERLLVWRNTLSLISDHPLFGVGGGNWQVQFTQYGLHDFFGLNDQIYLGYETFQRPHNDYLWIYAEAGVIGLAGFVGLLVIALTHSFRKKNQNKDPLGSENLMVAGIVAYFVIALSDFSIERFEHQLLMALLFVFAIPETKGKSEPVDRPTINPKALTYSLLALSLIITGFFYARLRAEKNHALVLRAHAAGDYRAMVDLAPGTNGAIYNIDNFSIPTVWYEGVARSAMGEHRLALIKFKEAFQINPWQVHVLNNLAGSYQQTGSSELALEVYRKALAIAPLHYEVLLNKSITEYNLGQTDSAFATQLQLYHKPEHPPIYHQAMPVIFNAWLHSLEADSMSGKWKSESIRNLLMSDSLKRNFLYHVQIEHREIGELLNTF